MSKYRIFKNKWKYFLLICERDNLSYEKTLGNNKEQDFTEVQMDISKSQFKEILEDIDCEIQRAKDKSKAPVISARTYHNPEKLQRLLDWYGCRSFRVLKRDEKKVFGDAAGERKMD